MDAKGALILTWDRPERGMENAAIGLLGRSLALFEDLIRAGARPGARST
jgi:hypothetical protein